MGLNGFIFLFQESAYDIPHPSPLEIDLSYYLWLIGMGILLILSLRKISRNRSIQDYAKMRCPNCGEEPYNIKEIFSGTIVEKFKGLLRCVNCDTKLKFYLPNSFWGATLILSSLHLIIFLPFLFGPEFYMNDFTFYFMAILGLVGFISMMILLIATAFKIRFVQIEEPSDN